METQEIITQISLLADAGLVVLIWMVQLIVYPSFLYYQPKDLVSWHQKYTNRIAVVVVPLMVLQLVIASYDVFNLFDMLNTTRFLLVIFLWIFTFTSFAPLHFKITNNNFDEKLLNKLIQRNWLRTLLWSLLLGIGLWKYFV
ncbi:hypothetical protein [Polaribacter sp. Hel_I_88]|uniref:hypothetical protein n=1 Tax=Polaribacter sp. Hel_I_88 TaxID=1250006 RepID=UPI000479D2BC|nr:hypothetical protein [Polaribacter sp. Hel_I_88]